MNMFLFYFSLFFIYSFIGWIIEMIVVGFETKKISDRGFLIGPYCPVYGTAALLIITILGKYKGDPLALYTMAVVLASILEYLTSLLMEKLFNTRWWDYKDKKFNINGRICLTNSVLFGVLGLLIIYVVNPIFTDFLHALNPKVTHIISLSILLIFLTDFIISWCIIYGLKTTSKKIDRDYTDEISKKVREILKSKSILSKRLVDAFPDFQALIKEQEQRNKQLVKDAKQKIGNAKEIIGDVYVGTKDKIGTVYEDTKKKLNENKKKAKENKKKNPKT